MQRLVHLFFSMNRSGIILCSFAAGIAVGTLLLMLPIANENGRWLSFVDALFTATSAACVTGLSVIDTGKDLSIFGQVVLIILIQIGGVGLMTITTLFSIGLGKRINIGQRLLIQESLNQGAPEGVIRMALDIIKYTLIIEFIFGTALAFYFYEILGVLDKALYLGYWHAISAFSNSGFDLMGGYASLTAFSNNLPVNLIFYGIDYSWRVRLYRYW